MPLPYIMSRAVAGFTAYCTECGSDPTSLLEAFSFVESELVSKNIYICQTKFSNLLEHATILTNKPNFGADFSLSQPLGFSGAFGALLASAPTLRTRLDALIKYCPLMTSFQGNRIAHNNNGFSLTWSFQEPRGVQFSSWIMCKVIRQVRSVVGHQWSPERIEFQTGEAVDIGALSSALGSQVNINPSSNRIDVASELLEHPTVTGDARAFEALQFITEVQLRDRAREVLILGDVRNTIIEALPGGPVTLETICEKNGLTAPYLQRQLQLSGTTFSGFLDETRAEQVRFLLTRTSLPLATIAIRVGLSEQSALNRFVKRYFKTTPLNLRRSYCALGQ